MKDAMLSALLFIRNILLGFLIVSAIIGITVVSCNRPDCNPRHLTCN